MISNVTSVGLILVGGMLLALVIRFVQPELIYGLRQVLVQVRTNKAFLDYEEGKHVSGRFQDLLFIDSRFETADFRPEYVFQRVDKIRELYRLLDSRRHLGESKLGGEHGPHVCIIELANLLGNLGRRVVPIRDNIRPIVSSRGLLTHIANEIRKAQKQELLESDAAVEQWFRDNPTSMEQTIELLIAAVYGLAYRQETVEEENSGDRGGARDRLDALSSIINMERRLRGLVRSAYQGKFNSELRVHARIRQVLGERDYGECLRRMEESRTHSTGLAVDFLDFIYIGHQETLVFGEWDLFRDKFKEKVWLKERIAKIIHARNELAHARAITGDEEIIVVAACREVESRMRGENSQL